MVIFLKRKSVRGLLIIVGLSIIILGCSHDPYPAPTWTIMVYMDADNDLESFGLDDLNEMEGINLSYSGINVIVLMDRIPFYSTDKGVSDYRVVNENWTDTKLFKVEYDPGGVIHNTIISTELASTELGLTLSGNEELNMGDPGVCSNFIDFCKSHYPAPNYFLIFWNHGSGWMKKSIEQPDEPLKAVCFDYTDKDSLYTKEIGDLLEGKDITVVGFDACYQGMLEVAYEIRNDASYMIASEETEPGDGWEYNLWLYNLMKSDQSPQALVSSVVDAYKTRYSSMTGATLSGIDLSKVENLNNALNNFANELYDTCDTGTVRDNIVAVLVNTVEDFYDNNGDLNIDIWDMADKIQSTYPTYAGTTAEALKTAVENAVFDEWHHTGTGNSGNPNAHGISIHFVPLDNAANPEPISLMYMKGYPSTHPLAFVADSTWVPHYSGGPVGPGLLYRLWFETF